jgi:hypothetical protein
MAHTFLLRPVFQQKQVHGGKTERLQFSTIQKKAFKENNTIGEIDGGDGELNSASWVNENMKQQQFSW